MLAWLGAVSSSQARLVRFENQVKGGSRTLWNGRVRGPSSSPLVSWPTFRLSSPSSPHRENTSLSLSLPPSLSLSLSLRIGPPFQPITEYTPYASRNERWPCSTSASSCWPSSSSSLPGPWCSVRLMVRRSLPSRERRPRRERRFPTRATAAAAAAAEPPTTTHLCSRLLIRATAASVHAAYAPVRPQDSARPDHPAPIPLHVVHSRASFPFLLPFFPSRTSYPSFSSIPSLFLSLFVLYFLLLVWIVARGFRTIATSFGSSLRNVIVIGYVREKEEFGGGKKERWIEDRWRRRKIMHSLPCEIL